MAGGGGGGGGGGCGCVLNLFQYLFDLTVTLFFQLINFLVSKVFVLDLIYSISFGLCNEYRNFFVDYSQIFFDTYPKLLRFAAEFVV